MKLADVKDLRGKPDAVGKRGKPPRQAALAHPARTLRRPLHIRLHFCASRCTSEPDSTQSFE